MFSICIVLVFFFSYITIIVNLYSTTNGRKKIVFGFYVYNIYHYIFFFWLLAFVFIGVFNLYSIGYFFFLYNLVVNLYDTAQRKNNQLYNYFCFWFLCLQHIPVLLLLLLFFVFGFCVYWKVFLICIVLIIIFFYITIVVNLYGTAHGKNN